MKILQKLRANVLTAFSNLGWIDLALASPAILAFLIRFRVLVIAGLVFTLASCSDHQPVPGGNRTRTPSGGWVYQGSVNGVEVFFKADSVMCVAVGTPAVKGAVPANHVIVGFN